MNLPFQILEAQTEKERFPNWIRVFATTAALVVEERSCRRAEKSLMLNFTMLLK